MAHLKIIYIAVLIIMSIIITEAQDWKKVNEILDHMSLTANQHKRLGDVRINCAKKEKMDPQVINDFDNLKKISDRPRMAKFITCSCFEAGICKNKEIDFVKASEIMGEKFAKISQECQNKNEKIEDFVMELYDCFVKRANKLF